MFRSLIWLAILFNTSISRYVGMCGATNNSTPIHCVKISSYFWSFFPCIRTECGPEITFHVVIARGYIKNIWWKREQVAINWASRNSSLHQSLRKCLRRVTRCQGQYFTIASTTYLIHAFSILTAHIVYLICCTNYILMCSM